MVKNVTTQSDLETAKHLKLIAAMLEHSSVEAACAAAGCSRTTGYRYLSEPAFQSLYRAARQRLVTHCIGRLQRLGHKALDALETCLLDSEAPPAVKVQAGRAVLDLILRAADFDLLESRITELEQQVRDHGIIEGQTP